MNHGGQENGKLVAPYRQLETFGIGARHIAPAIREAEQLGLVQVRRGARKGVAMVETSFYRLTYLPTVEREGIYSVPVPPTDEWRAFKPDADPTEIAFPSEGAPPSLRRAAPPSLRKVVHG